MSANVPNPQTDERTVLNGVDFLSGGYLTPPVTPEALLGIAKGERDKTSKEDQEYIKEMSHNTSRKTLGFDADLGKLTEARWGVIFAKDEDDSIKKEVEPLIHHRADHLGFQPKVFEYLPEMTYVDFLVKNCVSPGFGKVAKVPYYLLIIGNPLKIPFRFQYELVKS